MTAGHLFGPVLVSPALIGHLDAMAELPGVTCLWLTDWSPEMRAAMDPFPGRRWPSLHRENAPAGDRGWWKLAALEAWLSSRVAEDRAVGPEASFGSVVWLDDDLRPGGRAAACRRRLGALGVEVLLVAPRTELGITPEEMSTVGEWVATRVAKPDRHRIDEPWRSSAVAPCGCGWDGLHCPHCSRVTDHAGDAWSPAHTRPCHASAAAHGSARRRTPDQGGKSRHDRD